MKLFLIFIKIKKQLSKVLHLNKFVAFIGVWTVGTFSAVWFLGLLATISANIALFVQLFTELFHLQTENRQ